MSTEKQEIDKKTPEVQTEEQAKQALLDAAQSRRMKAAQEIEETCKKHNCRLESVLVIRGGEASHTIDVIANT